MMNQKSCLRSMRHRTGCSRREFVGGASVAATIAPLLAATLGRTVASDVNSETAGGRSDGHAWQGPQPTSKELGIDTPLPYLNDSWKIAVDLVDRGRRMYHEGKGLGVTPDRPGGFPGAWLPVSLGRRSPLVYPWDERDMRHTAKMIAYLWADEEGLFEEFERNLFVEQILKNGDFLTHNDNVSPYVQHVGMFMAGAADLGWCYGVRRECRRTILGNIVKLVQRTREVFDPEGSGFLNVGVGKEWHSRGFWGTFLGEPDHFPANFDGRNKLVIAGMAMAVFTKRFRDAAREIGAPRGRNAGKMP